MQAIEIHKKLHQFIDAMDDKKAEAIYTLLSEENGMEAKRRKLIQAECEAYLKGEGKSFTSQEVKKMALNKENFKLLFKEYSPKHKKIPDRKPPGRYN